MKATQTDTRRAGNTKSSAKSRKWCFTLNNYTSEEYTKILTLFTSKKWLYIIGEEIGEEGTPHLQGYIEHKNAIRFETLKKQMPRAHFERAKGSRKQNCLYCSKDGKYKTNIDFIDINKLITKYYSNVKWKPWQKSVLDICDSDNEPRTIHWYWESKGNVGKSFLCKYIVIKYDAIICDGKKENIFNQVLTYMNTKNKEPKIVICDIPRESLHFLNYAVIEQLKNGLIYSGKYEGGTCIFDHPHVIILCNEEPAKEKLSKDRWHIVEI